MPLALLSIPQWRFYFGCLRDMQGNHHDGVLVVIALMCNERLARRLRNTTSGDVETSSRYHVVLHRQPQRAN